MIELGVLELKCLVRGCHKLVNVLKIYYNDE